MKKLTLLLMALFTMAITQTTQAQQVQEITSDFIVRYGDYVDEAFSINMLVEVTSNNYATAKFALLCRAGGEILPTTIYLYGDKALQSFYNELKVIRNKYREWLSIAETNGVSTVVKTLPTMISARSVTYYDGYMNELKVVTIPLKALFRAEFSSLSILPSKSITIGNVILEPESVPIFHVRSVEDLDMILEALDITLIKEKIKSSQQQSNLFN